MDCAPCEQPLLPPLQFFKIFLFLIFSQKIFKCFAVRAAITPNHLFFIPLTSSLVIAILSLGLADSSTSAYWWLIVCLASGRSLPVRSGEPSSHMRGLSIHDLLIMVFV